MFTQLKKETSTPGMPEKALVVQKKAAKNRLESQRRARKKYNAKNSFTASTKLTAAERRAWLIVCQRRKSTTHAELRKYVLACIELEFIEEM